jgi:hypothetical protein
MEIKHTTLLTLALAKQRPLADRIIGYLRGNLCLIMQTGPLVVPSFSFKGE